VGRRRPSPGCPTALLQPGPEDFAMLRLVLLALLPQIGWASSDGDGSLSRHGPRNADYSFSI
jgi:hypothetical protein